MNRSSNIDNVILWHQKFILNCPLWVARIQNTIVIDANAIRPSNWRNFERKPPNELVFNVTEFCNASCIFCCYRKSKPRYQMSNEVFYKTAGEYYGIGGRRFLLNALTGEPLLDPLLFEKTDFLKSLGTITSGFTTNGILLNKDDLVESVIDSGVSFIRISTSGFKREVYEKVMGVRKYDEFLSGLCKLLKRNQETGNKIALQLEIRGSIDDVDTPDFSNKVLPFFESSHGKVTMSFLRLYTDWIGQIKKDDLPNNCGIQSRTPIRIKPCELSFNLGVMANGDLRLCHTQYGAGGRRDELTLGNINTDSLSNIWFSEKVLRMRRTTYGHNINPICQMCRSYMPFSTKQSI
jgi:radical SAM protein with 4Fe4S-binding SPASM domain